MRLRSRRGREARATIRTVRMPPTPPTPPRPSRPPRRDRTTVVRASSEDEEDELRADIRVKLGIAAGSGKLDLSDCDLEFVPKEVFALTDLVELSLAGNNLTVLPDGFGSLKSLEKLQLSGNRLRSLPDSLCALESLEGLWLHGNLLESLPAGIGSLLNLKQMAVAGNRLTGLPDSIGSLKSLVELVAAGNRLETLPQSIGTLSACRVLDLHGNRLVRVPEKVGMMGALEELWLQGNPTLAELPMEVGQCGRLRKLSVADCGMVAVPAEVGELAELVDFSAYGNALECVPVELVASGARDGDDDGVGGDGDAPGDGPAPAKRRVWLEGNPLSAESVSALAEAARRSEGRGTVGLDAAQMEACGTKSTGRSTRHVLTSTIVPNVQGYFKLERHPGAHADTAERTDDTKTHDTTVLVVAFGSAPGTPNWGGALRRVRKDLDASTLHADVSFDILYVVDPERSWYHGGDDRFREYDDAIAAVAADYAHVLYVGDSMGATACLLFAKHADVVHAFCPQIDLSSSSIRPGEDADWESLLKRRALDGIDACAGHIFVHVGNWQHDIQQVHAVQAEHALVKIYGVDSHRLAIALERSGKLTRILEESVLKFYGRMTQEGMQRIQGYLL